jgi:hypothetical protein
MGTGSLPGVKRLRHGVDHPPHLMPRLKKELSYTFTPIPGLRGLFQGDVYFIFLICRKGNSAAACYRTKFGGLNMHLMLQSYN